MKKMFKIGSEMFARTIALAAYLYLMLLTLVGSDVLSYYFWECTPGRSTAVRYRIFIDSIELCVRSCEPIPGLMLAIMLIGTPVIMTFIAAACRNRSHSGV